MYNLAQIEEFYQKIAQDLQAWLPEDVVFVDLALLHRLDLLHFQPFSGARKESNLTCHFQIVETVEKITLVNREFLIWIVPQQLNFVPATYTLIAKNKAEGEAEIEMAFVTSGIYNASHLIIKILEKFLIDIQETEQLLSRLKAAS